jgi:mono/diheme cytochrome c family protein
MTGRSRGGIAAGALAIALMVAGGALLWWLASGARSGPDPNDPRLVARGNEIYRQHCASCHGANLEGQPNWRQPLPNGRLPAPPHNAEGHTWHHSDDVLFRATKYGMSAIVPDRESDMPAFGGTLADADIWAVISYIESTWPPDIRARQQRLNRAGR